MQTDRGLDRLTYFTDAIAAIAVTLLILPLVDEVGSSHERPIDFMQSHLAPLAAFALSFAVISRLWIVHHSLFEHVGTYSSALRSVSLTWAFTIVLLPLPTAMVAKRSDSTDTFVLAFYVGTMLVSSALLTVMTSMVKRHPTLENPDNPLPAGRLRGSVISMLEFLLALLLGVFVPGVSYYGLLVLLVSVPISLIARGRSARRSRRSNLG